MCLGSVENCNSGSATMVSHVQFPPHGKGRRMLYTGKKEVGKPIVSNNSLVAASLVVKHGLQSEWASVTAAGGLSSCSSQVLEYSLSSCGPQA